MSQKPDLLQLQKRLYQQIHVGNQKMPQNADSVQSQLTELVRLCVGRVALICLDDMVRLFVSNLGANSLTTLLCCHLSGTVHTSSALLALTPRQHRDYLSQQGSKVCCKTQQKWSLSFWFARVGGATCRSCRVG